MTEERLIIHRYVREPEKGGGTGCYCPAAKGFCSKFTGPSEAFFQQNCEKCSVYGDFHERQERELKAFLQARQVKRESTDKLPARSWFEAVGSLEGVKENE